MNFNHTGIPCNHGTPKSRIEEHIVIWCRKKGFHIVCVALEVPWLWLKWSCDMDNVILNVLRSLVAMLLCSLRGLNIIYLGFEMFQTVLLGQWVLKMVLTFWECISLHLSNPCRVLFLSLAFFLPLKSQDFGPYTEPPPLVDWQTSIQHKPT